MTTQPSYTVKLTDPREGLLQQLGGGGVDHFAALYVMRDGDSGAGVPEQFSGQFDAGGLVDGGGDGAAEHVRGDAGDPGRTEDGA